MHGLITGLLFFAFSFGAYSEQGTMSTDDSATSESEASLSGYETQAEEVRLIEEEEFDPMDESGMAEEDEFYLEEEPTRPLPSDE